MEVRSNRFRSELSHDSLPFQPSRFEIQEKRKFKPADRKITNHLRNVGFIESGDHFGVNDNKVINDQVWHEIANQLRVVKYRKSTLCFNCVTASLQFNRQRAFVKFLIQP